MSSSELLYTAIGDSLTVGVGSSPFSPGFVGRYAFFTEQVFNCPVITKVFARIGATTEEVLASLSIPEVTYNLAYSDIITMTAGGNDLIHAAEMYLLNHNENDFSKALENSMKNVSRIIEHIVNTHTNQKNYMIRLIDLYNPLPNIQLSNKWISAFNAHLKNFSTLPHVNVVEVETLFSHHQKTLLSPDHIHPNDLGYDKIADALYLSGYAPLKV